MKQHHSSDPKFEVGNLTMGNTEEGLTSSLSVVEVSLPATLYPSYPCVVPPCKRVPCCAYYEDDEVHRF